MNYTELVEIQTSEGSTHGLAAVYSAMIVASVLANSIVLSALRKTRYRDSIVNQLIAWQCIAGLAVGLISMPLVVARLTLKNLQPEAISVLCMVVDVYSTILITLIFMNFVAVGILRYMYVFHPLKMFNGYDYDVIKLLFGLTLAGLLATCWSRYGTQVWPLSYLLCTEQTDKLYRETWLGVMLPYHTVTLSVLALYGRIYVYLSKQRKRVLQNRSQFNADGVWNRSQGFGIQRHVKKVNLVGAQASALTSFLFECSSISTSTLNFLSMGTLASNSLFLHSLATSFAFSMCFVPALLYCWSNEELRLQLLRPFTWIRQKKERILLGKQLPADGTVLTVTSTI